MRTRAIILTNGLIEDPAIIRSRLAKLPAAEVIAADGGSHHAERLGLPLHAVIGDLDSLSEERLADLSAQGITLQKAPPAKDETDLELALIYAAKRGISEIVILGAFGGRLDMSIANLFLMTHPEFKEIRIEIWHGNQTARIIRPPGDEIRGQVGDTLSLIPLNGEVKGVVTRNLAYPLREENLPSGPSRGLSNVLTGETANISIQEGILLAVHTPGHA